MGQADFATVVFLEGENPAPWQILLCHEGDVHVKTQDESLIAVLQGTFSDLGIVLKRNDKEAL
ncbi:hypothetical protein [Deinococcus arenicola]|uniref:Uncharacterized protein n=1 Tax=Deinococcus arenicola TaxID=2994950 RepID=A0ABU4DQX6_9DEIO|nr:hypothetical protein [Deinococcus sp. ZS9-10]MDV6374837.1 hypothetical protein [Deinococcus sp. ZS9-10]